jgi:uncharacterized membrane protein
MTSPRQTSLTRAVDVAITPQYVRFSPVLSNAVSLYNFGGYLELRFSDKALADRWAQNCGGTIRPHAVSYIVKISQWVQRPTKTHPGVWQDLNKIMLMWMREYL